MLTLLLHNLKFFSYHGIHPEEKLLGNEFEVNVEADWQETTEKIESIGETIDYVEVYKIISEKMSVATPLIETVAMEIGNTIHSRFSTVLNISVEIKKLHPGVKGIAGSLGIRWQKTYR